VLSHSIYLWIFQRELQTTTKSGDDVFSKIKCAILLASFCLAGCAPPTLYVDTNPVVNERIKSAKIVFSKPAKLLVSYSVYRGETKEAALKNATDEIERITKAVENHVPPQLASALQKKGVVSGSDAIISLRPTVGWGETNDTARVLLEVSIQTSDRTKQPWIARITDGRRASATAEQTAQTFTDRIVLELAKAGFVPQ
jgi:hypothetical protein